MSTFHRVPAFCVINQTRFTITVKLSPLRIFSSSNKIKDVAQVLHRIELWNWRMSIGCGTTEKHDWVANLVCVEIRIAHAQRTLRWIVLLASETTSIRSSILYTLYFLLQPGWQELNFFLLSGPVETLVGYGRLVLHTFSLKSSQ